MANQFVRKDKDITVFMNQLACTKDLIEMDRLVCKIIRIKILLMGANTDIFIADQSSQVTLYSSHAIRFRVCWGIWNFLKHVPV